jgi:hypothetical protein
MHQNRHEFDPAMTFYDRALDALAEPAEVKKLVETPGLTKLSPKTVESLAGVFNNIATLYVDMGREDEARATLIVSEKCLQAVPRQAVGGDEM